MNETPARMGRGGADGDAADSLDIWMLLSRVWARKWLLLLFAISGTLAAYVALQMVTPHYTGEVRVLLEGRAPDPTTPLATQGVREADQQKIESEIQVLLSRRLADEVVTALKLDTWEEFATTGGGFLGLERTRPANRADVIDAYFKRLNVYQLGSSRVIAIDFWAQHPRSATLVANAIADLYVAGQVNAQVAVTRRASSWLDQQVEKLRGQVAASEEAVDAFRRENGIFENNGTLLKADELSELNTQLILSTAARSEAQARLDGANALLNSAAGIETSSEVLDSSLIQQLREQEVALQRQITDMSADLLPQHPDMIAKQAELDDLRYAISQEVGKIARRLENDLRVARAREQALRQSISRLKKDVSVERQRESELRALEREAVANRGLLESFLLRASEAGARDDRSIQRPEARIISHASTPELPSFPKKTPIMILAFMASLTIGLLVVLGLEMSAASGQKAAIEPVLRYRTREPAGAMATSNPYGETALQPVYNQPSYGQPSYSQPAYAQPAYTPPAGPQNAGPYGVQRGDMQRGYVQPSYSPPDPFVPQQQNYQAQQPAYQPPAQPAYQQPRAPVTQVVARLPASPTMTQHDQWILGQAAQDILRFIQSRPARSAARAPGRIVRVTGGRGGSQDLVGLARMLSQYGAGVVAIGGGGSGQDWGLTDVLSRRAGFEHVMRADNQSSARFIGWGTIPVSEDPALIQSALSALAQSVQVVLVGDPDGPVYGLNRSFDAAADTALVFMRGTQASPPVLPQTDTAGIIQVV